MSSIQSRIESIGQQFADCSGWEEKYRLIIQMGKELPPMEESFKLDKYLVRGCQSQVWLYARLDSEGRLQLIAESDAVIVRGLVSLLLKIYSGATADEILTNPPHFLKQWGLEDNLSPSRTNGLHAMVKQIMLYATAFKALAKK